MAAGVAVRGMQAPVVEREPPDSRLALVTIVLLIIGTIVILDASFARDMDSAANGDAFYTFKRHLMWVGAGLVTLLCGTFIPIPWLKRLPMAGFALAVFLLILVLIPGIGIKVNGAQRWLGYGIFRFQPSEVAKIALVLFLAQYSDIWRGRIAHLWKGLAPAMSAVLLTAGLVALEDLGTAITIVLTGLVMILVMGARTKHLIGLAGLVIAGGLVAVIVEGYRMSRIWAWLDLLLHPFVPHAGRAYQPWQALLALGSGGVTGNGVGRGVAKHLYLPAEHTDYIFATVGEEAGFVGTIVLLLLFAFLIARGLSIAHRASDWFGGLTAFGLTCAIGLQAMLNIAVVSALVPSTGVPLPFISYGGTSLIFTTLSVGIILNVSQFPHRAAAMAREKLRPTRKRPAWPDDDGP